MTIAAIIYLLWNGICFYRMGEDKKHARQGRRRTPEREFFLRAFLLGAAGTWAGMYFFRHKTRHWKFKAGLPLLVVFNIILLREIFSRVGAI